MSERNRITPLPWVAGYYGSSDEFIRDRKGNAIFPITWNSGERLANAKFIVRACNRYDEAIELLRMREPGCSGGDRPFISSADLNRRTAAFLAEEPKP